MNSRAGGRLIWAVDVTAPADALARSRTLQAVRRWSSALGYDIRPTSVSAPSAGPLDEATRIKFQELYADTPELEILRSKDDSLQSRVDELLRHTDESKADAIALTTNARTGPIQWILGSFTQAVLLRSQKPLLTFNPASQWIEGEMVTLLPTDLHPDTGREFDFVLSRVMRFSRRLTLLHCTRFDLDHPEASFGPAAGTVQSKTEYLKRKRAQLKDRAEKARAAGFTVNEIFSDSGRDVGEVILATALSEKVHAIALVSRRDKVETALGMSVTRQVIRSAHCPVWAITATPPTTEA